MLYSGVRKTTNEAEMRCKRGRQQAEAAKMFCDRMGKAQERELTMQERDIHLRIRGDHPGLPPPDPNSA